MFALSFERLDVFQEPELAKIVLARGRQTSAFGRRKFDRTSFRFRSPTMLKLAIWSAVVAVAALANIQHTFSTETSSGDPAWAHASKPEGLLVANVTAFHLSSVTSTDNYTALSHPRFPNHRVRIKSSEFCDPTVK
jgi:hypothetical protein